MDQKSRKMKAVHPFDGVEPMLINCVAYREGKKLADIDIDAISDYLKDPDCFVWVALRDATPAELDKMRLEFDLHPLAIEDANHGHQRPKLEEYGDSLFAVVHLLEMEHGGIAVGEVDIFVGAISFCRYATAAASICWVCASAANANPRFSSRARVSSSTP
jgi:hypothetical protein